ncbi:hypothetical protein CALCODRAFT_465116 [Calocera cornea HHB12733]|uniref:NAD-dependent epimerase/dehydratase domain-containing protein n=1 Tax=Calocera cornea HHB12733 TaxID=1353952 RepID=A0A165IPH5_9BASI|nr:hypothetical protein CALCODRAFT_465116 [Calocera cornea HHB12733]
MNDSPAIVSSIMSDSVVLVTGVNGFLASATTLELLRRGYRVKGTRSQAKADAFTNKYPQSKRFIEWAIISDLDRPGIFDGVMDGVDYVPHIATPVFFGFTDNEKQRLRCCDRP